MQILKGKQKPCLRLTCKWCVPNDWILCNWSIPLPTESSLASLLAQRAELHMDMKNFNQAIHDGDSVCRLLPASPKVRRSHLLNAFQKSSATITRTRWVIVLWPYELCLVACHIQAPSGGVLSNGELGKTQRFFPFIPTLGFKLHWNAEILHTLSFCSFSRWYLIASCYYLTLYRIWF